MKPLSSELNKFLAIPVLSGCDSEPGWTAPLQKIIEADIAADESWRTVAGDIEKISEKQKKMRAALDAALGGLPERCQLNASVTARIVRDGYFVEKVLYESVPNHHISANLYIPDGDGPFPAILLASGHSSSGKSFSAYARGAVIAAKAGFAVLVYDPIGQGERKFTDDPDNPVLIHNKIGTRAALLGSCMAAIRIWDCVRSIDYLESRGDIDMSRIGIMGNSGGGTMSSYMCAFDSRIKSTAPSCFISSIRDTFREIGPQDAEQNIFGQLSFGLNHAGFLLLDAPKSVLINTKDKDFFPLTAALQTEAVVSDVISKTFPKARFQRLTFSGQHGWSEGACQASVAWFRETMNGETGAFAGMPGNVYQVFDDIFSSAQERDTGLNGHEAFVTSDGCTYNLPGERTIFDILRDKFFSGCAPKNVSFSSDVERARTVAEIARISEPSFEVHVLRTGCVDLFMTQTILVSYDGISLPAIILTPKNKTSLNPILILRRKGKVSAADQAEKYLLQGRTVMVADVRCTGEVSPWGGKGEEAHWCGRPAEEYSAWAYYVLGTNLVSKRAEDIICFAEILARETCSKKIDIDAEGNLIIPAVHARAVKFELIDETFGAAKSWASLFNDDTVDFCMSDIVVGALRRYDWLDLQVHGTSDDR